MTPDQPEDGVGPVPSAGDPLGDEGGDPIAENRSGASGSDPPLPISPARRRVASVIALVFIVLIGTFLIWFVATNNERRTPGGGMLGGWPAERSTPFDA